MKIWHVTFGMFELWPGLFVDGDDPNTRLVLARREVTGILFDEAVRHGRYENNPTKAVRVEGYGILWAVA